MTDSLDLVKSKLEQTIADTLRRMGPISAPCRGRSVGITAVLLKRGLVVRDWLGPRDFVLRRTHKGSLLIGSDT